MELYTRKQAQEELNISHTRLGQLLFGYTKTKKLKDGNKDYYYQPALIENLDYTFVKGRLMINKKGLEKLKKVLNY